MCLSNLEENRDKKAQEVSSFLTGWTFGSHPTVRARVWSSGLPAGLPLHAGQGWRGQPGPRLLTHSWTAKAQSQWGLRPQKRNRWEHKGHGQRRCPASISTTSWVALIEAGQRCQLPSSSALGTSVTPLGDVQTVSGGQALHPLSGSQAEAQAHRVQVPQQWQPPVASARRLFPSKQDPNLACLFQSERLGLRTRGACGEVIYSCSSFRDSK